MNIHTPLAEQNGLAWPSRSTARFYCLDSAHEHDGATKAAVAEWLASVLGIEWGGAFDGRRRSAGAPGWAQYWVPSCTLGRAEAARLEIHDEDDLFGGVVPHAFVATKLISHGLVRGSDAAPPGWCHRHGKRIADVVLPGYSAFNRSDAREAATRLLPRGAVRIKAGDGVGGAAQAVITDIDQLEAYARALPPRALQRIGIVLERNLNDVTTFSVGQVHAGPWTVAYIGTQSLTCDGSGRELYGGSTLKVVPGSLGALRTLDLTPQGRLAVEQARVYHREALNAFPGLFASRANYDVAQGFDDRGHWHSGVLEQSWRIGGASGAEVAALQAFKSHPALRHVCAATNEVYGENAAPPAHARVLFDGPGPHGERLLKYAEVIAAHAHA